jgi:hypothetical protein
MAEHRPAFPAELPASIDSSSGSAVAQRRDAFDRFFVGHILSDRHPGGGSHMWLWILLLIVIVIVFGLGFVIKWLFYVAIALFLIWLIMLLLNNMRGRR